MHTVWLLSYLLIDLNVNLVPLAAAANHRRGFVEILYCTTCHSNRAKNSIIIFDVEYVQQNIAIFSSSTNFWNFGSKSEVCAGRT